MPTTRRSWLDGASYLHQKGPERQMTGMPQIQSIRRMRRNGESIASIGRRQHLSEPTVRKYLRMDDLSEKPPVRKRRGSMIDPYLPLIGQWLAEDRGNWHKQRHTATRIWERLRDEHGAEVSLSTVTRTVARPGRESAVEPGDTFMVCFRKLASTVWALFFSSIGGGFQQKLRRRNPPPFFLVIWS